MPAQTLTAPSAIWPTRISGAIQKARLGACRRSASAAIASTAAAARYMNRRWVSWMSASRDWPKESAPLPLQPGNWSAFQPVPQAVWAPASGWFSVPWYSVPAT